MNFPQFEELQAERNTQTLAYVYGVAFQAVEEDNLEDALTSADCLTDMAVQLAALGANSHESDRENLFHVTEVLLRLAVASIERARLIEGSQRRSTAARKRKAVAS